MAQPGLQGEGDSDNTEPYSAYQGWGSVMRFAILSPYFIKALSTKEHL